MSYDVVVIGAGPGGYVAAIRASQCGLKTAIIEKRKTLGGTCLNVGCIPSKALLHSSHIYAHLLEGVDDLGIEINKPGLNLEKMMKHKQKTIDANTSGISFLMKKNKIDVFEGHGKISGVNKIDVHSADGTQKTIEAKNIIIATGSDISGIKDIEINFDEKQIVSSTGALSLEKVPEKMIVIGAGVIGSELGSVWNRLGSQVTVIEYMDKVLGNLDNEISKTFQKSLEKQGIIYHLGQQVTKVEKKNKKVTVSFKAKAKDETNTLEADVVLVAAGRRPYTDNLGLETVGIVVDNMGRIEINDQWQTCHSHIYAIGDVVKGPMLAHKAEEEAVAVAEKISGQSGHVNYNVIPSVVYTHPEVASVGASEEDLKSKNIEYNIGKFPFSANGRARAMLESDGFVKILSCKKTDKVLGGHIIGYNAGEMIHEIVVLMEFSGSSEDLGRICHAHPTMSEAVKEAALACYAKPFHM